MELVCKTCDLSKPAEAFHKANGITRGYQYTCKECKSQYQKDHAEEHLAISRKSYAKNIEKEHKRSADYHRAHPEKAAARSKKYKRTHRQEIRERQNARRRANPEKARLRQHQWRTANPEKAAAIYKKWAQKNRPRLYAHANARRILIRHGIKGERVNLDLLFKRDKGICQLCHQRCKRKDASRDHIIPLSRGGEHSYRNCVLAHLWCNSSKGNRTIPQQQRLF